MFGEMADLDDFNPLPSYEGRLTRGGKPVTDADISIHSPHTRGDNAPVPCAAVDQNFNPLPSYEGRHAHQNHALDCADFNPLPSYEGRRQRRMLQYTP